MRLLIIGFWLLVAGIIAGGNVSAVADELKVPSGCVAADGSQAGPHGYADRVIHEKTGIEMILLPAGTFTMGTNDPVTGGSLTAHPVTIRRPFYVGKTEVTNGQYRRFIKARPDYKGEADVDPAYDLYLLHFKGKSTMSDADEYPVVYVSWQNANAFCSWAGLEIPGEAQWEYACRAGTSTKFSFGDDLADIPKYAWIDLAAGHTTHPVATKLPNPWGLYDVHGNVWEWCADDYISGYKDAPADESIRRDPNAQTKPLRGGSWSTGPGRSLERTPEWFYSTALGSVSRLNIAPGNAWYDRGFRVILPLSSVSALPIAAASASAKRSSAAFGSTAPTQSAPAGILIGQYTFEEGSGEKVVDSSGRNNHGKNRGARYVELGPDKGFALNFDSLDASVDFGNGPDFDLRSHLSLEMWVRPERLPEVHEIGVVGKGFNSYLLSFTSHVWFYIDGGSNHCRAEHGLEQWYHVVAVYDRQNMNFYLDGKFVDQRPMVYPVAQGGNFFFRPPLSSDGEIEKPWSFMLDDVRIYSRALSTKEVARHYQEQAPGKP
jgi:formylglycine-generating enzyme required for sulfatase activity